MGTRETAFSRRYSEIIREERNFAAILYAALCRKGNIQEFINMLNRNCKFDLKVGDNPAVYFEYSYLRDWWHQIIDTKDKKLSEEEIKAANDKKLGFIKKHLKIRAIDKKYEKGAREFNKFFGVAGRKSPKHIQYPGKWSIGMLEKTFDSVEDRRKIAKFKWAFNIKPDIVIHLDDKHAICIETKYESREAAYPSDSKEKIILKGEDDKWQKTQTDIQRYLMEDLLGYKTKCIFLSKSDEGPEETSWKKVFGNLDLSGMTKDTYTIIETCKQGCDK